LTRYHKVGDDELSIAFASRSLAPAQKNYSQIALAIVFGKHFHRYLVERHFTIKSDHIPSHTFTAPFGRRYSCDGISKRAKMGFNNERI